MSKLLTEDEAVEEIILRLARIEIPSTFHLEPGDSGYIACPNVNCTDYCQHSFCGWLCTKTKNHNGLHIAHGGDTMLAVWRNTDGSCHLMED